MDVANASMYDGATATAEAALMARSVKRRGRVLAGRIAPSALPEGRRTRTARVSARASSWSHPAPMACSTRRAVADAIDDDMACRDRPVPQLLRWHLEDLARSLAAAAHDRGALLVTAVADAVMLAVVRSPGRPVPTS